MAYKALYRKYRPATFEDVVGQQHIVATLQNAIKNNKFSPFHKIENKLYDQFPDYKNKRCYFLGNGNRIKLLKTLKENNIENGNKIIIVIDEDDDDDDE